MVSKGRLGASTAGPFLFGDYFMSKRSILSWLRLDHSNIPDHLRPELIRMRYIWLPIDEAIDLEMQEAVYCAQNSDATDVAMVG